MATKNLVEKCEIERGQLILCLVLIMVISDYF